MTINLDVMLAKRKIPSKEWVKILATRPENHSIIKKDKVNAIRFTTPEALEC